MPSDKTQQQTPLNLIPRHPQIEVYIFESLVQLLKDVDNKNFTLKQLKNNEIKMQTNGNLTQLNFYL